MDSDLSLASFLQAARPDWKPHQLEAVEDKLEKVGVRDVLELVHALRGRSEKALNNRLRAVGEKCFTSETLSALRRRVREEPGLRKAVEQRAANARLAAAAAVRLEDEQEEGLAAPTWNPAAAAQARRGADLRSRTSDRENGQAGQKSTPVLLPTSKEEMKAVLADLGFHVSSACQARQMRSMLIEANRLRTLTRADLLAEVRGRLGVMAAAAAASKSEKLVRRLMESSFPDSLDEARWTSDGWGFEESPSGSVVDDDDDDFTFEIVTPSPEPLSLSTLFSSSREELLAQCHARGLNMEGLESKTKGVLALLLKMESRREYLQSLQASSGTWPSAAFDG
eukprot:gb/GFBE01034773.1/.p1 GENE.gb/GFBE01034773.1/~~gb/GFBE01034773.1/.p1  ORF type:complete len:339 (+),score=81.02 gb/GFBE01034773.1/:1-1017(+)